MLASIISNEGSTDERWDDEAGQLVSLGGRLGWLEEVSNQGACVTMSHQFTAGAPLLLVLPWVKRVRGTVVESSDGLTRFWFDNLIETLH